MRLEKYHGLGNDFLVLLDLDDRCPVDEQTARALCDRRRGVGADGLVRVTAGREGADVVMELRNADGGRAEMSGNGIRCLARALADAGLAGSGPLRVLTDAGVRTATLLTGGEVSVDMGPVKVHHPVLPVPEPRRHVSVDVGNPHVVVEVDDPGELESLDLATEALLSPGANAEFVAAGPGPGELRMRVWERGVGETLSCGTGSCAVAAAGREWGLVGDRVVVHQPGGRLVVDLLGDTAVLTGPAVRVASVEVAEGIGSRPCR